MLSKDVCKKCLDDFDSDNHPGWAWGVNDDFRWSENKVVCPHKARGINRAYHVIKITEPTPKECKFRFEQGVFAGMNNAK